jgi:cytochrome c553
MGGNALAAEPIELCAICHGEQGIPINKTTPVIWGQNEGYLYLQLRDFKSGTRKNELMSPIAATLEKNDMLALAAYFTKQKWPNLGQPEAPNDVTAKAQTAASSIGCRGCHLDHFQGDGTTARLAGQWQDYLQLCWPFATARAAISLHVRPDEGDRNRRPRRALAISRRPSDRRLSRRWPLKPTAPKPASRAAP